MRDALAGLHEGRAAERCVSFAELREIVGVDRYDAEAGRYTFFGFLQSTEIGGSIGSPVLAPLTSIEVPATEPSPFLAAQPGPKADIYAGSVTISGNAVQLGGSIWATQTTTGDDRLAVRWYAIDAATDILLQSGEVTDPTLDLYFPSIAVNEFDQVVIGMNGSSETDYVGACAAVGETVGGVTSFGDPCSSRRASPTTSGPSP